MASVVLGVGGGIAAYKTAELLRQFAENGHQVRVIPTEASLSFVGSATWEALSGNRATTSVFDDVDAVEHVAIGQRADIVVVAPATADLLARAAAGMADDLLTSTLLTAHCPIMLAPAMHTEMWENAATQANVSTLRQRGITVVEPAVGRLTGTDSGRGRLPDPDVLFAQADRLLHGIGSAQTSPDSSASGVASKELSGLHVVISAGGTREFLDPVRYLGNSSSGRQGYALAEAAVARGASVTLVAANVSLPAPAGAELVEVESTEDLRRHMHERANVADVVVMAAAVADFAPAARSDSKVKKRGSGISLELTENPDILAELIAERSANSPTVIGFAAETGDESGTVLDYGRQKLARKGCDFLVVNDVSQGNVFGSEHNSAVILGADGTAAEVAHGPKIQVADALWDVVSAHLTTIPNTSPPR